jgi:hypothetical protein
LGVVFLPGGVVVMLSAKVSRPPDENLTLARRMADDGVFKFLSI